MFLLRGLPLLLTLLSIGCTRPAPLVERSTPLPPSRTPSTTPVRAVELTAVEMEVHALVNAERRRQGLAPLSWNAALARIARAHSADMARRGFFDHVTPEGKNPNDRASGAGFVCRHGEEGAVYSGIAENLFQTYTYSGVQTITRGAERQTRRIGWKTESELAHETVQGWLDSPGHRRNLLNPRPKAEGIGVSITDEGTVYVTQNFC